MRLSFAKVLLIALVASSAQAQVPASAPTGGPVATEVPQVVAASNQDRDWQPTAEQRRRVLRDVRAYLAAKDEGRFADAYALFSPNQKTTVPFSRWEADMRKIYSQAGRAQGRTLKRITWHKDPANAPRGVYAAVDFSSRFSELGLHCGFVAMQMQMDGSFRVAREEENAIPKREMAKVTPEVLQTIRAKFGC